MWRTRYTNRDRFYSVRTKSVYFFSASNLSLPNSSSLVLSGTILKLTPTHSIVEPIGTVVNFTCSYVSAVPMEIDMHTVYADLSANHSEHSQCVSYVNFTGGAERVLMVRIQQQLSMVVCSLYNKHRYQLGQISTLIYAGADIAKNNNYGFN